VSSKMNSEWAFLEHLHDIGWRAAEDWITAHWDDIGVRPTYPLDHALWGTELRNAVIAAPEGASEPDDVKGDVV